MNTDPISDMLTRIRNAMASMQNEVSLPHSKLKESVAKVLVNGGFLAAAKATEKDGRKQLQITINLKEGSPVITELSRVSRPGRRHYIKAKDIPRIKGGRGIVVLSTPQGVMDGATALKKGVGGELICEIY